MKGPAHAKPVVDEVLHTRTVLMVLAEKASSRTRASAATVNYHEPCHSLQGPYALQTHLQVQPQVLQQQLHLIHSLEHPAPVHAVLWLRGLRGGRVKDRGCAGRQEIH